MIAALAAAALVAALPEGAARYRLELGGEPIGAAELSVRCAGARCRVRWETRLRLPREAGGTAFLRRVELEVGRDGRALRGEARHVRDGERWATAAAEGLVPAALAEVTALAAAPGCVEVFDEESLARGRACAGADGSTVDVTVLGVGERVVRGEGGFPAEVAVPEQGARFVRDPAARVPDAAPVLYGTRVPGPADPARASAFCGVARDPAPHAVDASALPPPRADGASCRDKAAAYVEAARRAGFPGRTAVGVAWDGRSFVWHAWAEVRVGGAWVPVDPSFRELPAAGPRFTVARYGELDRAARVEAGRRTLACWGHAGVVAR